MSGDSSHTNRAAESREDDAWRRLQAYSEAIGRQAAKEARCEKPDVTVRCEHVPKVICAVAVKFRCEPREPNDEYMQEDLERLVEKA